MRLWPWARPRLLLDGRENDLLRGWHVVAAATLLAPGLAGCRLNYLTTGHPDEQIAFDAFRFDTGLRLTEWQSDDGRPDNSIDLLVMVLDGWPGDRVSRAALRRARHAVLGLTFETFPPRPAGVTVVDGHDTAAIAAAVLRCLGRRRRGAPT